MHLRRTGDRRKGLYCIYQSDNSLMHFCWKDGPSGTIEDDLIIFPEIKKLPQCTSGITFILKFKSSTRKFFFGMQEPKGDNDEEHCKKVIYFKIFNNTEIKRHHCTYYICSPGKYTPSKHSIYCYFSTNNSDD